MGVCTAGVAQLLPQAADRRPFRPSVLADTTARLEGRDITVLLSGLHPRHDRVLRELGVHDRLGHDRHLFATTPDAIAHARRHVAREHHAHGAHGAHGAHDTRDPHEAHHA